jgi:hypothetical protein
MANQPSRGPVSGSPTLNEIANASSATDDPNPMQYDTVENNEESTRLLPLFQRLHDEGCARDVAGNRVLHCDQYCVMVLVF